LFEWLKSERVNFEKSKTIDIDKIRGNIEISSQAQKLLNRSGLLYSGHQYVYDFAEDGSF
jgi:hypothetical protein